MPPIFDDVLRFIYVCSQGISINSSDNNFNSDGSDDKMNEILRCVENFNMLFSVATSVVQIYYEKNLL